jgi:hypothetical protein
MKQRIYSALKKKHHVKWHKGYNQEHNYSIKGTRGTKYTWAEMYLIWNKRLKGGRVLTDIEIAKILRRSLQAVQLKRHKMKVNLAWRYQ